MKKGRVTLFGDEKIFDATVHVSDERLEDIHSGGSVHNTIDEIAHRAYETMIKMQNKVELLGEFSEKAGNKRIAILKAHGAINPNDPGGYYYIDQGVGFPVQRWIDWMSSYLIRPKYCALILSCCNPSHAAVRSSSIPILYPDDNCGPEVAFNTLVAEPPKHVPDLSVRLRTMYRYYRSQLEVYRKKRT